MSLGMHSAGVYTDFQGLTELKSGARKESPEAIREAARQFEALFLQMMLKNMRAANLGDGMLDNDQSKMYLEMFDKQVALDMSKGQGIGLADMLVRQLGGSEESAQPDFSQTEAAQALKRGLTSYGVSAPATEATSMQGFSADNPQSFVQQVWPHAKKASQELGIDARVLVAQAALETGWGQSMIQRPEGGNSFNFFGIKAGTQWTGDKASSVTHEYIAGEKKIMSDEFRAYRSIEQSFSDYVDFIKSQERYEKLVDAAANNNVEAYVNGLQEAGYATDPQYANKIKAIVNRGSFNDVVASLQSDQGRPL